MQFPPVPPWVDLRPGAMPRRIDRRFQLVRLLNDGELPDFAHDWADTLVWQTLGVLRGVQPADAIIKAALDLRTGPLLDRGELEARLLAGQEVADVAAAMGMPVAVIETYAQLYFDLAGQTQARSWVLHEGIGRKAYCGLTPDDVDVILKLIGFVYGLGVLEPMVRYYRRGLHRVADPGDVPDLDGEERAWAQSIRYWVALRTMNDPVAILKLRAAFPETRQEPVVEPGLHHRVTLDMAAEAVARAADVARTAPKTAEMPVTASVEPARKPARRRTASAAGRRTRTRIRPLASEALVPAGA